MSQAVLDAVRPRLAGLGRLPSPAEVAAALRVEGCVVSDASVLATLDALRRGAVGAGPLEPLLRLDAVTDVLVNGPDAVFVDTGEGLRRTEVRFHDDEEVRALAVRLAAAVGRRLDDAQPFVDARLPDGTRLHAVLASVACPGTCVSLRVPSRRRLSLQDWVDSGSVPAAGAVVLSRLVSARRAFLVSGGTGSGKTTLLGTLLGGAATSERIVIVEDSRELLPDHEHCVWLEGRPANAEGAGAIALTVLVRQALRMRPDRLVLGEVRGGEVVDLLTALNTGHEGGCGTVHANSAADVPARLEALGALAGLGREAIHAQMASALHVVVHVARGSDGRRLVRELHVVRRRPDGFVETELALRFGDDGRIVRGPGAVALEELLS